MPCNLVLMAGAAVQDAVMQFQHDALPFGQAFLKATDTAHADALIHSLPYHIPGSSQT